MLKVHRIRIEVDRAAAQSIADAYGMTLVTDMTRMIFNRGNVLTPVDTGNLRAHNRMRVARRAPGVVGEVFNEANYAAVVHDGSGPYVIRPRRRKALRFIGRAGEVVYARQVRHPGTRGRPWLAQAGREVAQQQGWLWHEG